jgi:tRNA dimethylallyltransferase
MATKTLSSLPLIVIVGPTASGKTALAVRIASLYGGEIVCADSRTVYRGMDIGTAKPTRAEQMGVPHWGLDLVDPGERFTAFDFKRYAEKKIDEIRARNHIPFLVGGTGLYIDAVVFNYQFHPGENLENRKNLEILTIEELHEHCNNNNITIPENRLNKRYVIRAIEQKGINIKRGNIPVSNTIIVGIATDTLTLRKRIEARTEQLFDNDVVKEATMLSKKYGWDNEAMTGNIYPLIREYIENGVDLKELKDKSVTLDWRLAKRQMTWLRRNPFIQWYSLSEAYEYITHHLANA